MRILLFLIISFYGFSQHIQLSKKATISVLTCQKGKELYSLYGHTALRVNDTENQIDWVYNYGTFDFNTPNFYLKFIKGDLQYFASKVTFTDFIYEYNYLNRNVFEQQLVLTIYQKQQLLNNLENNLNSENRFYTYKYIDKNCTTIVLDQVNQVLTNKIATTLKTNKSYRKILFDYQKELFFENLGINIIFGQLVDKNGEKVFLPNDLMKVLNGNKKIALTTTKLNLVSQIPTQNSAFNSIWFFAVICLVTCFLLKFQKIQTITFLIFGNLGLLFCIVGLYSFHKEVLWNYNALLFNPLFLVIPFIKNIKTQKTLFVLSIILLLIYLIIVLTKIHLFVVWPILLISIVLHCYWFKKNHIIPNTNIK